MAPDKRDDWPPDVDIDEEVFEQIPEAGAAGVWWIGIAVAATVGGLLGAVLERMWG